MPEPRVVIVAEFASLTAGGEAARPVEYFRELRRRGVEAWLVTHERSRAPLAGVLDDAAAEGRVHYVANSSAQRLVWAVGQAILPQRVLMHSAFLVVRLMSQRRQKPLIRRLIAAHGANLVHEPVPISPMQPTALHSLGVPVVLGPLNGAIDYPPGFRRRESALTRAFLALGRSAAGLANRLVPGKRRAALILVSNERTRRAVERLLSPSHRGRIEHLVANAVDLSRWAGREAEGSSDGVCRFLFLGRLVDFKGVDLLIDAFAACTRGEGAPRAELHIVGDGPLRASLQQRAEPLGERVVFHGWKKPDEAIELMRGGDVFVLPTLQEAGGAVVMEAMCLGLPVIASDWGGPPDYLVEGAGVLVPPTTPQRFTADLAAAMRRLAAEPETRRQMGRRGREHALSNFGWPSRVDRLLEFYRRVLSAPPR